MADRGGLDWSEGEHAACVLDAADGRVVAQFTVEHTQEGLATLQRRLAALAPAAELPVALERPSGLVVDALLPAGPPVVPIHPNVVQACRSRYRAAHGKSDRDDASLLADLLRTDGHRFRPLTPCSEAVKALRALVRSRDDLVADRVALTNRLRNLLHRFWPGAATLFAALDSPIALAFLRAYRTPGQAAGLDEPRLAGFLARQGDPSRRSAGELLERRRERFPSEAQLAAEAGVCPVTRGSGQRRRVVFRFACHHRLRRAITGFADHSRQASAWAAAIDRRARARGCAHPQPSAFWPAPGSASCGEPGSRVNLTTLSSTVPPSSSPHRSSLTQGVSLPPKDAAHGRHHSHLPYRPNTPDQTVSPSFTLRFRPLPYGHPGRLPKEQILANPTPEQGRAVAFWLHERSSQHSSHLQALLVIHISTGTNQQPERQKMLYVEPVVRKPK